MSFATIADATISEASAESGATWEATLGGHTEAETGMGITARMCGVFFPWTAHLVWPPTQEDLRPHSSSVRLLLPRQPFATGSPTPSASTVTTHFHFRSTV
jgi:hypothetical protein